MYVARPLSGSCAQKGCTDATSSTTAWTSSGRSVGTEPTRSPVRGLNESRGLGAATVAMWPFCRHNAFSRQGEMKVRSFLGAALGVAVLASPASAVASPTTVLARSSALPGGAERLTYQYGPLEAAPGHNLILVGPVTVEKPP